MVVLPRLCRAALGAIEAYIRSLGMLSGEGLEDLGLVPLDGEHVMSLRLEPLAPTTCMGLTDQTRRDLEILEVRLWVLQQCHKNETFVKFLVQRVLRRIQNHV